MSYFDGFVDAEDVCVQFGQRSWYKDPEPIDLEGHEILFAVYQQCCYSGDALVVTQKDGRFFEVQGSHCSCYGLEGQWEPVEVTKEYLLMRCEKGRLVSTCCDSTRNDRAVAALREILQ